MRILIDIPDEQLRALDEFAQRRGWSRARAVRQAIADWLERDAAEDRAALMACFGAWAADDGQPRIDGQAFQQAIRSEWDRPWDKIAPAGSVDDRAA